jgi:hypothetical protein
MELGEETKRGIMHRNNIKHTKNSEGKWREMVWQK